MNGLSMASIDAAWWPYLFILIAGGLATEVWRWIGVIAGDRLRDDSEILIWTKCVATALIAAVIGKLVVSPTGSLETVPLLLRVAAGLAGWLAFRLAGSRVLVGVLTGEALLVGGQLAFGG